MTHPGDDLLAMYVDGTLPAGERAAVDAHLATCARCTNDIADATEARVALRAIPDVSMPADVVIPTATGTAAAGSARLRGSAPAWHRWAGPAAAAAAAMLVLTLVLPKLGGGSSGELSADGGANRGSVPADVRADASQVPLEIQGVDYDPDTVSQLAARTAAQIGSGAATSAQQEASSATSVPKLGSASAADKAATCIQTAFREVDGTLVRLIRADFQGAPAYVGLYAVGPGAGQPADSLTIRVAAVETCTPLSVGGVPL